MATVSSVPEAAQRFLQGSAKGLWIDNAYVDASGDATITAYNPADGSELGVVQEASAADVDARRQVQPRGVRGRVERADAGRPRPAAVEDRGARGGEPRGARDARDAQQRQADRRRASRRHPQHRGDVPLLRGLDDEDHGPDDPRLGRQLPRLHPPRAGRRDRRDHPLELPADDGRLEARAGPRLRQHDDHQAGGADAALDAAPGRDLRGGGPPGRRRERRSTAWARPRARPWSSTRASTRSRSPAPPRSAG